MTYWEWFSLVTGAATLMSLAIGLSSLWNGKATRALIREMQAATRALLDRMDQWANERHSETSTAIDTLRRP
jgi:hypothetical protein